MGYESAIATKINTVETNRVLADPLRVSIVEALQHAEMSARELADLFGKSDRLIHYHLRRLVQSRALDEYRMGHQVTYVVSNQTVASACHVLYELWADEATRSHSHAAITI